MSVLSVVRFDGLKSRDWFIYKFPSESLVLGSQLIVQEGQAAIFIKGGVICDVFHPGTYTLKTENLPILKGLVNLPFGGKTPFSAEIYFINSTVKLDINWGTTDPIQLIDPKYYVKLRIRAFGQMGLRIIDCTTLFKELIGGMQQADLVKFDKVKVYYRGILVIKAKTAIADAIITNKISALEISTKLEDLSQKVKKEISPEFEKYGFQVSNFYIQSINFPDEDFEKINKILFFFIVQIDTFQNFIAGMVFKVIGFSILAVLILGNILTSAIKTGYFVPMLIIAIMYNIILDIFNIFGIMAVSSGFFSFLHFILLFIFCLLSIPMYIMGKR